METEYVTLTKLPDIKICHPNFTTPYLVVDHLTILGDKRLIKYYGLKHPNGKVFYTLKKYTIPYKGENNENK